MRSLLLPGLFTLSFALCSCGSGNHKLTGLQALQKGEYEEAFASLDKAFAELTPDAPDYMEVAMGRCSALAHVDAPKARTAFEAIAQAGKAKVADYSMIVGELLGAKAYEPAAELMDSGLKQFPEDKTMLQIRDRVVEASNKAAAANDPKAQAAQAKLKGMGYLGDDD